MSRALSPILAILLGVGGVMLLYWVLNAVTERLPSHWEHRLKPYVFVFPAMLVVTVYLIYPAINTVWNSFRGPRSQEWVGFQNYVTMAQQPDIQSVVINNFIWIAVVPTFAVIFGLIVAVLADRLSARWENITKSLIFLPMAISFVGASVIWNFVYAYRPEGLPQIGILNAFRDLVGAAPIAWLQSSGFRLNTLLLTVIMVWLQAGFAMVLLSAAIKGVPEDTLEAARIDGATDVQIFFRVVIPQIKSTIFVVFTTIVILVMKVFDIVFTLTNGNFDTDVIANRFYNEIFRFAQFGRAAVLVVVLMVAVIPLMVANIKRFREEEATR